MLFPMALTILLLFLACFRLIIATNKSVNWDCPVLCGICVYDYFQILGSWNLYEIIMENKDWLIDWLIDW